MLRAHPNKTQEVMTGCQLTKTLQKHMAQIQGTAITGLACLMAV